MRLNYHSARRLLDTAFAEIEAARAHGQSIPPPNEEVRAACEAVFRSATLAYREALLGCLLARIQQRSINIRLPYIKQGPDAFSARSLDANAVNPFLSHHRIPSTKGPYLSVFRRQVRFVEETRSGVKDPTGYDALLACLSYVESLSDDASLHEFLRYLLDRFFIVREESIVPLARIQRISLGQYSSLILGLLDTPSGGRFPVLLSGSAKRF
jgi:hypothetical protein